MATDGVSHIPSLPDEILAIVCQELGRDRDFGTLYRCALSAKSLADPALRTLYEYHDQSPAFLQSDEVEIRRDGDFATKTQEAVRAFLRWTALWRSIILSCLDDYDTYKPYCRYLRMLDFRNLTQMLEDFKFGGQILRNFFDGPLKLFHFPKQEFKRKTVDVVATINAVGDAVTLKTSQIEEIAGHLSPGFLPRWVSRSPKLQALVLWKGDALANGAGQAVAASSEHFRQLTIHEWRSPDADDNFSTFLNALKPDTLADFTMISYNNIGPASFEALSRHKSLQELTLANLSQEAMQNLNKLSGCTELHTLLLEDNFGTLQLEPLHNDVFVETVAWLSSCTKLRDLTLKRFYDGPAILSQVLSSPSLKLKRLSLEGYLVRSPTSGLFHTALSEQKTLQSIWLKGSGEETVPDDLQIMVEGLSKCSNLKELVLKDVSDEFEEDHIVSLVLSLPQLEDFWTSGGMVSSDLLPALTQMNQLKNLTLYAMTQFRCEEIIDFLGQLDPVKQRGFNLSLMAADPNNGHLTDIEQDVIREFIRSTLDGRFDFVLWREAETSDSDDD